VYLAKLETLNTKGRGGMCKGGVIGENEISRDAYILIIKKNFIAHR